MKNLLKKLDLTEKQDCLPDTLSEAQKRLVSFGTAFIGDASVSKN